MSLKLRLILVAALVVLGGGFFFYYTHHPSLAEVQARFPIVWGPQAREACLLEPNKECVLTWALSEERAAERPSSSALTGIATLWAKPVIFEEAKAAFRAVVGKSPWSERDTFTNVALSAVARGQAAAGFVEAALDTSREFLGSGDRSRIQSSIVWVVAKDGDFERAVEIARNISHDGYRAIAISRIILIQSRKGVVRLGLEDIAGIEDSEPKRFSEANALTTIARSLVRVGMTREALAAARQIGKKGHRSRALAYVAVLAKRPDLFAEAKAVAQSIEHPYLRESAIAALAPLLAEAGLVEEALALLRERSDEARNLVLADLVPALAAAGELEQTIALTANMRDPRQRAEAIFRLLAVTGDKSIPDRVGAKDLGYHGDGLYRNLAWYFARAGNRAEALKAVGRIERPHERTKALASLAVTMKDAELVMGEISALEQNDDGLVEIAAALTELGQAKRAVDLASRSKQPAGRVRALIEIAKRLPPTGPFQVGDLQLGSFDLHLAMPGLTVGRRLAELAADR